MTRVFSLVLALGALSALFVVVATALPETARPTAIAAPIVLVGVCIALSRRLIRDAAALDVAVGALQLAAVASLLVAGAVWFAAHLTPGAARETVAALARAVASRPTASNPAPAPAVGATNAAPSTTSTPSTTLAPSTSSNGGVPYPHLPLSVPPLDLGPPIDANGAVHSDPETGQPPALPLSYRAGNISMWDQKGDKLVPGSATVFAGRIQFGAVVGQSRDYLLADAVKCAAGMLETPGLGARVALVLRLKDDSLFLLVPDPRDAMAWASALHTACWAASVQPFTIEEFKQLPNMAGASRNAAATMTP